MNAQVQQMQSALRTTVALDVLRLPIEEDIKALRFTAIGVLTKILNEGE